MTAERRFPDDAESPFGTIQARFPRGTYTLFHIRGAVLGVFKPKRVPFASDRFPDLSRKHFFSPQDGRATSAKTSGTRLETARGRASAARFPSVRSVSARKSRMSECKEKPALADSLPGFTGNIPRLRLQNVSGKPRPASRLFSDGRARIAYFRRLPRGDANDGFSRRPI